MLDFFPDWSWFKQLLPRRRHRWSCSYKAPDLWLSNKVKKRSHAIRKGLPDALDLLVICAEAGLTVDAAFSRVARELGKAYPELGDEFGLTAIELGFLNERRQAFENLATRVDLEAVRGVVTTMIQTEKYGTPLASALRVLSAEFRNERMMRAEEKAARLPAIMTVPLILFILPTPVHRHPRPGRLLDQRQLHQRLGLTLRRLETAVAAGAAAVLPSERGGAPSVEPQGYGCWGCEMNFTSDPNTVGDRAALVFLLGLLVGMCMTAGGRRKWKHRYKEEVDALRQGERDEVERPEREKEWRERDSLRAAAVKDRRPRARPASSPAGRDRGSER